MFSTGPALSEELVFKLRSSHRLFFGSSQGNCREQLPPNCERYVRAQDRLLIGLKRRCVLAGDAERKVEQLSRLTSMQECC
jgi:hypothetical protein